MSSSSILEISTEIEKNDFRWKINIYYVNLLFNLLPQISYNLNKLFI